MYRVYQFFLTASILFGLLGIIAIAVLIYGYVQANNSEEMAPLTGNNNDYAYPGQSYQQEMANSQGRLGGGANNFGGFNAGGNFNE